MTLTPRQQQIAEMRDRARRRAECEADGHDFSVLTGLCIRCEALVEREASDAELAEWLGGAPS